MRILFISNYYPPNGIGGYEQWCQEVAEEFNKRGHQIYVITSGPINRREKSEGYEVSINRSLNLEVRGGLSQTLYYQLFFRQKLENENINLIEQVIKTFQPDLVFIWGMWNVARTVPEYIEKNFSGPIVYYICDYWLSLPSAYSQRWQAPSRRKLTALPKVLLSKFFLAQLKKDRKIQLKLEHPICVSRAVRDLLVRSGLPLQHAQVIYGGTQVNEFLCIPRTVCQGNLRLLYVGRLTADKGVHTAIEAIRLVENKCEVSITLDIVGQGDPDYEDQLKRIVTENQIESLVSFCGSVSRDKIPGLLSQYDVLVFPSQWDEPFARIVLEAMAAGLTVIGTTTGGSSEILKNLVTGLTFPVGDSTDLAAQIQQLCKQPDLRQKLAEAGQKYVRGNFTFSKMVDELEISLKNISERR